jgi:transcriptional antiterminator RfaH
MMNCLGALYWYVIRTKPRQEARAAENLAAWGIEVLSPLLLSAIRVQSKPLFPGYIFARFRASEVLHKINFTRGVACIVSFGGKPAICEDCIIDAIRTRGGDSRPDSMPLLTPGQTVRICSGPWHNFLGVFERNLSSRERVQILLTTIAFTATIELARSQVSPVSSPLPSGTRS